MCAEAPLHPECTVAGLLSFVLRLSRVTGVAPLKVSRTRDGWSIRVSHYCSLYGETITVLFTVASVIVLVVDVFKYQDPSLDAQRNHVKKIIWMSDVLIVSAVAVVGAFTGVGRMRAVIDCIAELKQVSQELAKFRHPKTRNGKKEFIVVPALIFGVILIFVDYSCLVYKAVLENSKVIVMALFIFFNFSTVLLYLLVIQFFLVAMMVLTPLKELNNCFEEILQDLQKNKSTGSTFTRFYTEAMYRKDIPTIKCSQVAQEVFSDASFKTFGNIQSVPRRLNNLIRLYGVVTDVIGKLGSSHGPLLVILLLSVLLHMVITYFHNISSAVHPERYHVMITVLQGPWAVHQLSKLVMIVEPCHRTHDQLATTKDLIVHMTRYVRYDDFAILAEIKSFFRLVELYQGRYAPMQLFVLNRTIVVTMLSSITTYIIIVVQLRG